MAAALASFIALTEAEKPVGQTVEWGRETGEAFAAPSPGGCCFPYRLPRIL